MILLCQLPIGFFDLICIRIPGDTQDRVKVFSAICGIPGIGSSVSVLSISCHHTPPVPAAYAFRGTGKLIFIILLYLLYNTIDSTGQAGRGYFLLPFSFSFFCGRIGMIIFYIIQIACSRHLALERIGYADHPLRIPGSVDLPSTDFF
jgi:hypothetical protein